MWNYLVNQEAIFTLVGEKGIYFVSECIYSYLFLKNEKCWKSLWD